MTDPTMESTTLSHVTFPGAPIRTDETACGKSFVFPEGLVDVLTTVEDCKTHYHLRVSNPTRQPKTLAVRFVTGYQLAYVPTWLHNPPVYDLKDTNAFSHYGLPQRVGLDRSAFPADVGLAVAFNPGDTNPSVMLACETVDKGVGIVLGPDGIVFSFLDGTERLQFELDLYAIKGRSLLDCIAQYQGRIPYNGITTQDNPLMCFVCTHQDRETGAFDMDAFRREAEYAAAAGARYAVMEGMEHHHTHFDERYWSPKHAAHLPDIKFFSEGLDALVSVGLRPLMYYNCVHGQVRLFRETRYSPGGLLDLKHIPVDRWAQKDLFEKNYEIDMNWFTHGKPHHKYPMDTDPTMDIRNPEWRRWITSRVAYMLENYPQLAGTYVDTWPAGLPFFGKDAGEHAHDFGEHEWWNGMEAFMWEIRQATKACGDKVFMINDSRMPKKLLEAADLILNENAGPVFNPEKVFWHCLRAAAVGHNSKPSYQFHHWKQGMTNPFRAKAFFACASVMNLGYCIYNGGTYDVEGDTVEAYHDVIDEMSWTLTERSDDAEISISSESRNIESLKYSTSNHRVEIDFPGREVSVAFPISNQCVL